MKDYEFANAVTLPESDCSPLREISSVLMELVVSGMLRWVGEHGPARYYVHVIKNCASRLDPDAEGNVIYETRMRVTIPDEVDDATTEVPVL